MLGDSPSVSRGPWARRRFNAAECRSEVFVAPCGNFPSVLLDRRSAREVCEHRPFGGRHAADRDRLGAGPVDNARPVDDAHRVPNRCRLSTHRNELSPAERFLPGGHSGPGALDRLLIGHSVDLPRVGRRHLHLARRQRLAVFVLREQLVAQRLLPGGASHDRGLDESQRELGSGSEFDRTGVFFVADEHRRHHVYDGDDLHRAPVGRWRGAGHVVDRHVQPPVHQHLRIALLGREPDLALHPIP